MNPWDIVSWIGAIAVGVVIVGITVILVKSLIKPTEHPVDRLSRRLGGGSE